jgi:hypothetical protein
MPLLPELTATSFQTGFHRRWNHLRDPDVRALAWLLDAPDLFDPHAPQWRGQIASLPPVAQGGIPAWLAELDHAPAALHAALNTQTLTRLGRYAEKLMAFYFQHQGNLVAHGVQVRASKNETVGEFDFLLRQDSGGAGLLHWEFATKFYLFEASIGISGDELEADTDFFVGPNLADSLGAKMGKILDRQLALAQHPAAQAILPQAVTAAAALVKGWLFYRDGVQPVPSLGLSPAHCRGFWCALGELEAVPGAHFAILPRLSWLAPAKLAPAAAIGKAQLLATLRAHFAVDSMPVMVVVLRSQTDAVGGEVDLDDNGERSACGDKINQVDGDTLTMLEQTRGFVVPDDWRNRAAERPRRVRQAGFSVAA